MSSNNFVSMAQVLLSVAMVTILVFVSECNAAASCPINKQVEGPEKHAVVRFTECTKKDKTSIICKEMVKEITLAKNVTTNVGYDKNGYAVMAKYTGRYTCLSWYSIDKVDSYYQSEPKINKRCQSTCYEGYIRPIYKIDEYCDKQAVCNTTEYSLKAVTTPGLPSHACRQMTSNLVLLALPALAVIVKSWLI